MTVNSLIPEGDFSTLGIKQFYAFVSLNEILKECLKKAQARVDNLQLIVRCENLPKVLATREEMMQLFDDMLAVILNHRQLAARSLFLYVDCEEDDAGMGPHKQYCIKFHTNITTDEHWKLGSMQTLSNCRKILSKYNGTLAVNDISSAGCLFSLSLPGKIE